MAIKKSSGSGIPFGNNAGRPANPGLGQLYSNGEAARLELYTQASGWQNIIQEVPGIASITGNYSEATNSVAPVASMMRDRTSEPAPITSTRPGCI